MSNTSAKQKIGWKQVGETVFQTGKDFFTDNAPEWAAAIAYYSLLSVFPLLLAAASIAAFFVDPGWAIDRATRLLGELLPQGGGTVTDIVKEAVKARESVSIISLAVWLWSGSRVFGVVTKALNIAYDADETFTFAKRTLTELVMMFTIGILFIIALVSRAVIRLIWSSMSLFPRQGFLFDLVLEIVPGLLLLLVFYLVYRFVPRRKIDSRAAFAGSLVATLLFLIARPLFSTYITHFANLNLIYGSIAVVIVLVIWIWIAALIILFGGELVSHIQKMLIEGYPTEIVDQQHQQRSPSSSGTVDSG